MPQLQRPEGQVAVVAEEITQRAVAERPPVAPVEWHVPVMIRSEGRRPEPEVPVERVGHGGRFLGGVRLLDIDRFGRPVEFRSQPHVDFPDRADGARTDKLDDAAVIRSGMNLRAHLRGPLVFVGDLGQDAGFADRVRQRLLAVAVLAHPHRHRGGRRVDMIGRTHHDGVDLAVHLLEHLAEVAIPLGLGELLHRRLAAPVVDVAEGHDILAGAVADVPTTLPSHANPGNREFLVWGLVLRDCRQGQGRQPGGGRYAEHFAAMEATDRTHDGFSSSGG